MPILITITCNRWVVYIAGVEHEKIYNTGSFLSPIIIGNTFVAQRKARMRAIKQSGQMLEVAQRPEKQSRRIM
jgi:hypothetical protein